MRPSTYAAMLTGATRVGVRVPGPWRNDMALMSGRAVVRKARVVCMRMVACLGTYRVTWAQRAGG